MQSAPHIFAGAHDINASHSTFNAAGRDINMYINNAANENEILATLRPVERRGHAHRCMEGTRKDVLQDIDHWLDDFSTSNILLLTGSPGAGKSTIATTVVSNLYRRRQLGSSFPFNHSDTSLSDPNAVWRTVAFDLARFHPGMKGCLIEVLNGVDPGTADIIMQFERLIEGPLMKNHTELSSKPPVVVLDALDECASSRTQSDQRRKLIQTLMQWNRLPRVFKLIVTSRDERLPESFCKLCLPIILHTGNRVSSESANDIRLFLQKRFADIAEDYPSLSNWPGESRIEQLTGGAAGLFIWAETLARFVGNEEGPPDEQLNLVLQGDLGAEGDTISELYRRIIHISFATAKGHIIDVLHAIVGVIVLAKVPLCRDDIVHFLNKPVTESTIDLVLNKLSSVISIGKADKIIHVCHLSFVDFICDATRSTTYFIDRATHSQSLASACFRLMRVGLKFNICDLETSHLRNDKVPDLADRIQKSIPGHLSYACRFGWQHLRDMPSDVSTAATDKMLKDIAYFLHVQLLQWLEVMSFIEEVSLALTALHYLTRWAKTLDTDLAAFAADAARFVVNFAVPISASVPHIYLSALPWSPRKSKIARHFLPNFPHTLSILTGQDNDWPAVVNLLEGHTGSVACVGFSPDGKHVVSGSQDSTIRIWDAETGETIAGSFVGHTEWVRSIGFSPDGKRIVSGSDDNMIHIWDAETGEATAGSFEGHTHCVTSVAFSPDGKHIVSGSGDNTIRTWDAKTGETVSGPLEGHTDWVRSVGFSPDGKHIVSGSDDRTIRIWDAEMGETVANPFEGHTGRVTSVGFSPDGKRIVSGSWDTTIRIWDAETGETIAGPFKGHTEWVISVGFSPDGKRVVSGSDDKTIRIWDAETGETVAGPLEGHTASVDCVGYAPDGKRVVSGSRDKTIRIWDVKMDEVSAGHFEGHTSYVNSVGFSPDGKRVVSGSSDKTILIWDAETGEVSAGPFEGHTDWVYSVAFSPDGKRIVSGSDDNMIRIWDAETGETTAGPFEGHTHCVTSVAFSPDGKHVVSGSADNTIRIWDAETGETVAGPLEGHTDWVRSAGFSRDGKHVISASDDGTTRIWDFETGETLTVPSTGYAGRVRSIGFPPNRKPVISGSNNNTIRILDTQTGETIVGPFEGHTDFVRSVGFSHDGRRVVSGSDDNTIRVWDTEATGVIAGPLENHPEFKCCHFNFETGWITTPDGHGLLFWVPATHRGRVCGTDTIAIMGDCMTRVGLGAFVHGSHWEQCHEGEGKGNRRGVVVPGLLEDENLN